MKRKQQMKLLTSSMLFFFSTTVVYGGIPLWTFDPITATTLTVLPNSTATVQYRVTNQSKKTHTLTMKSISGIHQDTSPGNCSNPFTLTWQQSCLLSLTIVGNELTGRITEGPIVCQANPDGTPNPNLCYRPSKNNSLNITLGNNPSSFSFVYVPDNTNVLWQCPLDTNGGISGGACIALTNLTSPGFKFTSNITFATFSGTTYAYVTDYSNTVWQCPINASGGISGGACTALTNPVGPAFNSTNSITFATFLGITYGYVSDSSTAVWKCPMSTTGQISGDCIALTNGTFPSFLGSYQITFHVFSGTNYAYVTDTSPRLWQCPMDGTGNFSSSCTLLTNSTPPGFGGISTITFSNFLGATYIYVSDFSQRLWQCLMDDATGGITACTAMINLTPPGFQNTSEATLATFSGTTYVYVADDSNTLWQCPVNAAGSISGACAALTNLTPPGFSSTLAVGFNL